MIDSAPAPVVIATFRSLSEAQVARSAIESAGIEVMLGNEHTIGLDWLYMNALGGLNLVVAAEDADRAVAVLQGIWPEEDEQAAPAVAPIEIERCPSCGSQDLIRIRRLAFLIVFSTLMLAIGYVAGQRDLFALLVAITAVILLIGPNRRCVSCGERWQGRSIADSRPQEVPVEPRGVACPRCGSTETAPIDRRRLKALTMLIVYTLPPLLFVWPFLPKRKCDECGLEWR